MALFGIMASRGSIRSIRRGRPIGACIRGCLGAAALAVSLGFTGAWLNLGTYSRLTHEQSVATLTVREEGSGTRSVVLTASHWSNPRIFLLPDGGWQLDARVLKWAPWANVLGLDSRYRLERLSNRPNLIGSAKPHTGFNLHDGPAQWLDIWSLAYAGWLPAVDTVYGSSVYGTLAPGAHYEVTLSQSGLLLRKLSR